MAEKQKSIEEEPPKKKVRFNFTEGGSCSSSRAGIRQREEESDNSERQPKAMRTDPDEQDMPGLIEEEEDEPMHNTLHDAIMSVTQNEQVTDWLITGGIPGINSKEEEKIIIVETLK